MIIELGIMAAVVLVSFFTSAPLLDDRAHIIQIGAAVQFKLLDILRHRLKQQRDEEEAKAEAEEVAQAAERFKNVGSELNEWEEKHGSSSSPRTPGSEGYSQFKARDSVDFPDNNRSSVQLPSLGFDETRAGKTSSTASLLMRNDRNSTYNAVPAVSPSVGNTPTTMNFSNLGLEEMLSPEIGRGSPQAAASDPELESKSKLLEEVKRARESVHSSLEKIRAGTPTPTIQENPSPTTSYLPINNRPTSALASSADMRSRRGSTTSSRMLDAPDQPRATTQTEWDSYVQSRNVITPPVVNSPGLSTSGAMMNRGSSHNSHYALVSDGSARASSSDRRERTTSMMDLSGPDEWGPRETLSNAPQHTSMGRRAMSFHESPIVSVPTGARPQHRESGSYAPSGPGQYRSVEPASSPMRSRHSSGPRAMTYEELSDRHRKRLSALQEPVTAKIKEPLEVATARAEWEKQKRLERAEMQKREAERLVMMQEREKRGPVVEKKEVLKSTDEWRRSIATGLDKMATSGPAPSGPAYPAPSAQGRPPAGGKRTSHRTSTHFAN